MRTPRSSSARRAPVPPSRGPDGAGPVGSSAARSTCSPAGPPRRRRARGCSAGSAAARPTPGRGRPASRRRAAARGRRSRGRRRRERPRGRPTSRGPAAAPAGRARSPVAAGQRPHRVPLRRLQPRRGDPERGVQLGELARPPGRRPPSQPVVLGDQRRAAGSRGDSGEVRRIQRVRPQRGAQRLGARAGRPAARRCRRAGGGAPLDGAPAVTARRGRSGKRAVSSPRRPRSARPRPHGPRRSSAPRPSPAPAARCPTAGAARVRCRPGAPRRRPPPRWTAGDAATASLSATRTFSSTCGRTVTTPARSARLLPVWAIRAITRSAVSSPSPVVA